MPSYYNNYPEKRNKRKYKRRKTSSYIEESDSDLEERELRRKYELSHEIFWDMKKLPDIYQDSDHNNNNYTNEKEQVQILLRKLRNEPSYLKNLRTIFVGNLNQYITSNDLRSFLIMLLIIHQIDL